MDAVEAPRNEDSKPATAADAAADTDGVAGGDERQTLEDTEKVLEYLKVCGIDPSHISVDDIDPSSLTFILDWAKTNPVDKCYGLDHDVSVSGSEEKEAEETISGARNSSNDVNDDVLAMAVSELVASDDLHNELERKVEKEMIRLTPLPTPSKTDICSSCDLPDCADISSTETFELKENEHEMKISAETPKAIDTADEWSKLADACREHSAAIEAIVEPMAEVEKINYDELEPWQRALFQRLDNQQKAIEKCQTQIQKLMVIAEDRQARGTHSVHGRNEGRKSPSASFAPAPNTPQAVTDVVAPAPNANALPNVVAANDIPALDRLLHMPRSCYKFIITSRPVRIVKLLRHEAANFRHPGNPRFFDVQLMFKLAFICLFLRARMSGANRNGGRRGKKVGKGKTGEGGIIFEILALTRENSAVMLPISAVIVYFIQTGLLYFLYQNIFKNNVIARVWRNEDLEDDDDVTGGTQAVEAVAGVRGADGARENARNEFQNMRRGRRDRVPIAGRREVMGVNDLGANGEVGGDDAPAGANGGRQNNNPVNLGGIQAAVRADLANRLDDTFMAGFIDPTNEQVRPGDGNRNINDHQNANIPREEILLVHMLEGMKDVLYLFGSFFLSLFPMWHPRAREDIPEAADTAAVVTEEINPVPNNDEVGPLPQVEGQNNDDVEEEDEDEISEGAHNEEER